MPLSLFRLRWTSAASWLCIALLMSVIACAPGGPETLTDEPSDVADGAATGDMMDDVAETYVRLVLELGNHDKDYVDAYYGDPAWRQEAEKSERNAATIGADAAAQVERLVANPPSESAEEIQRLRHEYLVRQLSALSARARLLGGEKMSFDEESQALYDVTAPVLGADYFQGVIDRLESRLVDEGFSEGSTLERLEAFRSQFIIPTEKVDAVFRAAIDACRERTAARLELPEGESFTVEYVKDKSWSAYNWYQGEYKSLIQVNLDLPIYIDRAVDLACHEGYPGHHVYNALLEKNLVRDRGWVELSVYPLFSPLSLIAEGSANYGIEMAFPGDERRKFEAEALYPIAGFDPSKAETYHAVMDLADRLAYAGNEAARGYLDGTLSAEQAADWLVQYAAMTRPRAEQRLRFIEQYRSYVINYNLGQDLVAKYIETLAGDDADERWRVFGGLLSSPRLPSGLQVGDAGGSPEGKDASE